jgi:hypothetical protein
VSSLDIEPFEVLWDDEEAEIEVPDYPLVAEGTHVMQIMRAEIAPGRGPKSADPQKNPKGLCLKIALELKGHKWVWADTPLHWRGLVEAVHRAARLQLPRAPQEIDPSAFLEQMVTVEIGHYVGRNGDGAKVVKWKEGLPPPPAPLTETEKKSRQTAAQKNLEEFPQDDIPF